MVSQTRKNKQKGAIGQHQVRDMFLKAFPELEEGDVKSNPMGNSGADLIFSPLAQRLIPYNVEVKRKKAFSMARYMEQADNHGSQEPVLFFREDRGTWYTVIKSEHFFQLLSKIKNEN